MSTRLARRSLPHRLPAFTALALTTVLGTALAGSFATLVEVAQRGSGVSVADAEALNVMGAVVGSWSALVVVFAVVSTTGVLVAGRVGEIALLRTAGATPRQVRALVVAETAAVAVVASTLGALLAWPGGRALLAGLREAGMVATSASVVPGISLAVTAGTVTLLSLVAAWLGARRASRAPLAGLLSGAESVRRARLPWWRRIAGLLLVGYGVGAAIVTVTVSADSDDPYAAMQTSGSACIVVALGLAAWAPALLRASVVPLRVLTRALPLAASTRLGLESVGRRADLLAGTLGPMIVLTSTTVGVAVLTDIDARTLSEAVAQADLIRMLNGVVAALIALFAAVLVINANRATQTRRRAELSRLRLLGALPGQVAGVVRTEWLVVSSLGVVLGLVASCATTVPFALARDEGAVADSAWWLLPTLVGGVVAVAALAHRVAVGPLPAIHRDVTAAAALADARVLADA